MKQNQTIPALHNGRDTLRMHDFDVESGFASSQTGAMSGEANPSVLAWRLNTDTSFHIRIGCCVGIAAIRENAGAGAAAVLSWLGRGN